MHLCCIVPLLVITEHGKDFSRSLTDVEANSFLEIVDYLSKCGIRHRVLFIGDEDT